MRRTLTLKSYSSRQEEKMRRTLTLKSYSRRQEEKMRERCEATSHARQEEHRSGGYLSNESDITDKPSGDL